jgi:hypothetical protein
MPPFEPCASLTRRFCIVPACNRGYLCPDVVNPAPEGLAAHQRNQQQPQQVSSRVKRHARWLVLVDGCDARQTVRSPSPGSGCSPDIAGDGKVKRAARRLRCSRGRSCSCGLPTLCPSRSAAPRLCDAHSAAQHAKLRQAADDLPTRPPNTAHGRKHHQTTASRA